MKKCKHKEAAARFWTLRLFMTIMCSAVIVQLANNAASPEYREAAAEQGNYKLRLPVSYGTIYDRNGMPLVNRYSKSIAVLSGDAESVKNVFSYAKNKKEFLEKAREGVPFSCEIDYSKDFPEDIMRFEIPIRYDNDQIAQHIIGYMQEGNGVCGLEYDYDDILRMDKGQTTVTFPVDGAGKALSGENAFVRYAPNSSQGVVTTIDIGIQLICEKAAKSIDKGVVIVMDTQSGDILGLASRPVYSVYNMEEALDSEDSPFINRAIYAYPVGSIFKLVTAASAIDNGLEDFSYECTGSIEVESQNFFCHDRAGHGMMHIDTAMINSCNPYFIELSTKISALDLFETAAKFGFGHEIFLSESIIGESGYLPDVQELMLPAEKGNFAFGQGKLTATPLQIARMTSAIANGGILPHVRLVVETTDDGSIESVEKWQKGERILDENTAKKLRKMMVDVVYRSSNFKGRPKGVSAGAKTSTAQTGRFDENGEEYCHAWIKGFFPAYDPKFTVTVLAEDSGYGNDAAAPVFKNIIEGMRDYL